MASGSSQSPERNVDSSDSNLYPTQRHAGKVSYGPNFAAGGSVIDKLTGLAYEIKGKVTHDPALVHHGHEVFTGEAKRKKVLGIDDDDPVFESGKDAGKKQSPKTQDTASSHPSGTVALTAEHHDNSTPIAPGTKAGGGRVPNKSGTS